MNSVNRLARSDQAVSDQAVSDQAGNDQTVDEPRNAAILRVLVIGKSSGLLDSLVTNLADTAADIELCEAQIVGESRDCYTRHKISEKTSSTSFDVILFSTHEIAEQEVRQEIQLLSQEFNSSYIVVTASVQGSNYADLVDAGLIAATVPVTYNPLQVASCLRLVNSGVHFIPVEYQKPATADSANAPPLASKKLEGMLTPRQLEVLKYVALGKSNKHIATELSLCESTVKVHVHEVMKRLGATSRTHATYLVNTQFCSDTVEQESPVLATS